MLNTTLKKGIKVALPLLLGGTLVWYSLQKIALSVLAEYFKNANYFWIGLGVFFGILSHLSRAYRWKFMIEPMGYRLRLPNSTMAVFATYLINYTIPRAGEISRATILANYEGVPFEKGFGTIVAERIADSLVMLLIIGIAFFLEFDAVYGFLFQDFNPKNQWWILVSLVTASSLIYVLFKKSTHPIILKLKTLFKGFLEGALSVFKMEKKWAFIAHTFFIWGMYVLMFYVTSLSIEATSDLPLSAVLIGFIAASFSIAATNGGIGSYPLAVYAAFTIFNVAQDPSLAFGWIMWSSQTIMIIILGGLSLILLPVYNKLHPKRLGNKL